MSFPLSALLRDFAKTGQYGRSCTPKNFFMSTGTPGTLDEGYSDYYWSWQATKVDFATWKKVAKLSHRYRRFVHYCTETLPQWKEVKRIHYADNSIEAEQVSVFGTKRTVMVDGPHGDVCF